MTSTSPSQSSWQESPTPSVIHRDPPEIEEEEEDDGDGTLMALFHAGGRMGAAAYTPNTATLRILEDVDDLEPDHTACKQILFQVNEPNFPNSLLQGLTTVFLCS